MPKCRSRTVSDMSDTARDVVICARPIEPVSAAIDETNYGISGSTSPMIALARS
jgi:hypothetical protein